MIIMKHTRFDSDSDLSATGDSPVSDSESDSSEFASSSSADGEEKLTFTVPSVIVSYGKSTSGKSTVIAEMIIGRHFNPAPKYLYLLIGGRSQTDIGEKVKPFVTAFLDTYAVDVEEPIKAFSSFAALDEQCSKASAEEKAIPKLLIIDDMLTGDRKSKDIQPIVTEMSHHHNMCVVITTQTLFVTDGRSLRNAASYQMIFRGYTVTQLGVFLRDFPESVQKEVKMFFASQDKDKIASDFDVRYNEPAIIDTNIQRSGGSIVLWRGLNDRDPMIVSEDNKDVDSINTADEANAVISSFLENRKRKLVEGACTHKDEGDPAKQFRHY